MHEHKNDVPFRLAHNAPNRQRMHSLGDPVNVLALAVDDGLAISLVH